MRVPMRKLQEAAPCAYTPEEADEELSLLEKKCRDDVDYLKSTGWALPGFVLATPRPEDPAAIVENEQLRLRGEALARIGCEYVSRNHKETSYALFHGVKA
eukprot:2713326-Prorocentrum_lima.AAC.1